MHQSFQKLEDKISSVFAQMTKQIQNQSNEIQDLTQVILDQEENRDEQPQKHYDRT